MCEACGMKPAVSSTSFCSRRCNWIVCGRCPQCGRPRDCNFAYCSPLCSQQAMQANWCPCCGTCQIALSGSCSNPGCAGSSFFLCQPEVTGFHATKRSAQRMGHCLLAHGDTAMLAPFNAAFAAGLGDRIVNVIKLSSPSAHRKQYLSYRSAVENTMTRRDIPKYGHGGEGNEQRRYFPISLQCGLATRSKSRETVLRPCGCDSCEACTIMARGLNLQQMNRASHYCTTSVSAAIPWSTPNMEGFKAILVARAVIGQPELIIVQDSAGPPEITFPCDPDTLHSTIVTTTDPTYDGTYLFRDDAVDPQFLVVFQ